MAKTMTVYEAVKDGMEKNPNLGLGKGSPYTPEGSYNQGAVAACCAIGFAALSQCSLDDWQKAAREHAQGFLSGALYHVLKSESHQGTIFSWNDEYIRDYEYEHGEIPSRATYLEALKNNKVGGMIFDFRSCDEDWVEPDA